MEPFPAFHYSLWRGDFAFSPPLHANASMPSVETTVIVKWSRHQVQRNSRRNASMRQRTNCNGSQWLRAPFAVPQYPWGTIGRSNKKTEWSHNANCAFGQSNACEFYCKTHHLAAPPEFWCPLLANNLSHFGYSSAFQNGKTFSRCW